jgi:hypothetical protein
VLSGKQANRLWQHSAASVQASVTFRELDHDQTKAINAKHRGIHLEYISKVLLPSAAGSGKNRLLTTTQEDQGWLNDVEGVSAGKWHWG